MNNLNKEEMLKINGGGFNLGFWALIGSGIAFIVGIIDGFTRPYKCN